MAMAEWVRSATVAFVLLAMVMLVGCESDDKAVRTDTGCPSTTPVVYDGAEALTVDEVVDRLTQAITCPGYVLHVAAAGEVESEDATSSLQTEAWVDAANNQGRAMLTFADGEGDIRIVRSDGEYELENDDVAPDSGQPPQCHGPGREVLGLLINCLYLRDDFETSIDASASFDGSDAVALVTGDIISSDDGERTTTYRVYFDAATFLPLAQVIESVDQQNTEHSSTLRSPLTTEFVALDSLASDFFDPASIGYVRQERTDPFAERDYGVGVYWLGMDFAGSEGFPPLAYDSISTPPNGVPEIYNVLINYRLAHVEFGPTVVSLELSTRDEFDAFIAQPGGSGWRGDKCVQREEIELPGRTAVLYSYPGGPRSTNVCPPPDRYRADVFAGETVIAIDPAQDGGYHSEEAMEYLVAKLELRKAQ